jgi:nucleotide-binding universal stress UspA family protein
MASRTLRILVGVDFSRESLRALRAARALAARAGGTVTIAHVRSSSDVTAAVAEERGDLLRARPERLASSMQKHYERRLAALRQRGVRTILLRGVPSAALCAEARRGYGLLVLGTRGRGRVANFLLGSTLQDALRRSPIPLLVTR